MTKGKGGGGGGRITEEKGVERVAGSLKRRGGGRITEEGAGGRGAGSLKRGRGQDHHCGGPLPQG